MEDYSFGNREGDGKVKMRKAYKEFKDEQNRNSIE